MGNLFKLWNDTCPRCGQHSLELASLMKKGVDIELSLYCTSSMCPLINGQPFNFIIAQHVDHLNEKRFYKNIEVVEFYKGFTSEKILGAEDVMVMREVYPQKEGESLEEWYLRFEDDVDMIEHSLMKNKIRWYFAFERKTRTLVEFKKKKEDKNDEKNNY